MIATCIHCGYRFDSAIETHTFCEEGKSKCDCPCAGPFCTSLIHPCQKPKEHISQRDYMYIEFKKEVIKDIIQYLKKYD